MYSYGVFLKPVLNEFGWTRAVTSGAFSLNMVLTGSFAILAGKLVDRFGPRLVLTVGGIFLGSAYLLMSRVTSVWEYYLYYGVLGSIGVGSMVVPCLSTVARWFTKGRSLATGIVISGIGLGVLSIPQLANGLISNYSWRISFLVLGIIALALIIGFAQLLKRAPDQLTQDSLKTTNPNVQNQGLSIGESLRTNQFWIIAGLGLFLFFAVEVVMVHIVAHATDIGFSASTGALLVSTIGLVSIFAKIATGSLADKIGNRNVMIIVSIVMAGSFMWLRFANQLWMLYVFTVIFGLGYAGFATAQSPLAAEFFGLKSHGSLFGLTSFAANGGGALGSFLAGYIFDVSGEYDWAFYICIILAIVSLIISILLRLFVKQEIAKTGISITG